MHLLSGIPIAVTGFLGSWMVISVNAWMNHPSGFRLVAGRVVDLHPWKALFGNDFLWHELIHMYIAAQGHRPSRASRTSRPAHRRPPCLSCRTSPRSGIPRRARSARRSGGSESCRGASAAACAPVCA